MCVTVFRFSPFLKVFPFRLIFFLANNFLSCAGGQEPTFTCPGQRRPGGVGVQTVPAESNCTTWVSVYAAGVQLVSLVAENRFFKVQVMFV